MTKSYCNVIHSHIELLAPAKNLEVGRAAIDAGADAVYIGGPAFGARKAAGNSLEDIAALCEYAHFFSARVLVTLNTLLHTEEEMREAVRLAYAYRQIGVDALIIQDLQLAQLLFDSGDFEEGTRLHASTQCDNRTLERVQQLEAMGFKRVVLARELSYQEITHIREHTNCELEAFVHGALCVSYSGACYLSEDVCGRSANRGECAQMCRLAYDVLDENQHELLHQKHILSLKDLDRSQHLRELLATGVTTLKIEGRLKDIDYVRNVVAYYRMHLDEIMKEGTYQRTSWGTCYRQFTPNPEKTFHRGATEYFAYERPAELVNMDTPKSTGEFLGIAPIDTRLLHNGDGITFHSEGFYWPNNRVRIPAGTRVYRNYDAEFHKRLMAPEACTRLLPVHIHFAETPTGFKIEISPLEGLEGSKGFSFDRLRNQGSGFRVQVEKKPATNAERAEAMVKQQLSKLGGTLLEAASVTIQWSQPYFLPVSVLNEMRRNAVQAFIGERRKAKVESQTPNVESRIRPEENHMASRSAGSTIPTQLMTCKYCILHELGCCRKKTPRKTGVPTYLRQNNLLLRILTDCASCTMTLVRA